jgi:hypothetical protein
MQLLSFWLGNLQGQEHLGGLDVNGKITLKWIFEKQGVRLWTGFICFRMGTSGDFCGLCNKHSSFISHLKIIRNNSVSDLFFSEVYQPAT